MSYLKILKMNKRKLWKLFSYSFLIVLIGGACSNDNEEELYPSDECQTENVTYSVEVLDIIEENCYKCHDAASNFGNVTLEGYENLKKYVDSGQLLGTIQHKSGFSPMPKNEPQLEDCDIDKIAVWIDEGALEN